MADERSVETYNVDVENFKSVIRMHVGSMHVGTPDATIEREIRNAVAYRLAKRDAKSWRVIPTLADDCVAYALQCHHENYEEYRSVLYPTYREELEDLV